MTKTLILHLSDLHISAPTDAILSRADAIAAAVQDIELNLSGALVLLSGDLAYSGSSDQYLLVWEFIEQLEISLRARLSGTDFSSKESICVVAIPGNHDCDFSGPTSIRNLILDQITKNPTMNLTPEMLDACLEVQQSFFEALSAIERPISTTLSNSDRRLAYKYEITLEGYTLELHCFNSAWLSQLHETQGTLLIRDVLVPDRRSQSDIVIAMFHHPFNWYPSDQARSFQKKIEAISDFILTGHEHDPSSRRQEVSTGANNLIMAGGALQETGDPDASAFHSIVVDFELRKQKAAQFSWDGEKYSSIGHMTDEADAYGSTWEDFRITRVKERSGFDISERMLDKLSDLGTPIVHKQKGVLHLHHVFAYPELQGIDYPDNSIAQYVPSSDVRGIISDSHRLVFMGDSEAGKTAFSKQVFLDLYQDGFIPILLDGRQRPQLGDYLVAFLTATFAEQYSPTARESYLQLDRSRRVIIVDDYHRLPLSTQRKRQFLEGISQFAARIILMAEGMIHEVFELAMHNTILDTATPFETYRIAPMGQLQRNDLVERWLLLDNQDGQDASNFALRRQTLIRTLDAMTANNRLPRYPLFILTVLQASETVANMDTQIGTHGAYYDLLIRMALARGRSPVALNVAIGYLSHLAYEMFTMNHRTVSMHDFHRLHRTYEELFDLNLTEDSLLNDFKHCQILETIDDRVKFKHRYIFYYFVAIWLRDNIDDPTVRKQISQLTKSVHVEEFANVLMFLAHLSKDPLIFDEVLTASSQLLKEFAPATLREAVFYSEEYPGIDHEYVDGDVQENRRRMMARMDEADRLLDEDGDLDPQDLPSLAAINDTELDPIGELMSATKMVEIIGQLLKNFPGNVLGTRKVELAQASYNLGLRSLGFIYFLLTISQSEMIEIYTSVVQARDSALTKLQAEKAARDALVGMAEAISASLIRFISDAVGAIELENTYDRLNSNDPLPSVRLINASIQLDFFDTFPEAEIIALSREYADAPYAKAVLQLLVIRHFKMFQLPIGVRQRICSDLGILFSPKHGARSKKKVAIT